MILITGQIHTELAIDVETYSDIDIKFGATKYASSDNFELLILSYQFFQTVRQPDPKTPDGYLWEIREHSEEPIQTIDFLTPGKSRPTTLSALKEAFPEHIRFFDALVDPQITKTAYNARFERSTLKRFTGKEMPPEQWNDTMILASSLGLPRSLADVGKALHLNQEDQKMKEGKALIRFFSKPYTDRKTKNVSRHLPGDNEDSRQKWELYKTYNAQDVQTEHTILKTLIKFRPNFSEEQLWNLDQKINDRGVALDIPMAENIIRYESVSSADNLRKAQEITCLQNPNSVPQLLHWLTTTAEPRHLIYNLTALTGTGISEILQFPEISGKEYSELYTLLINYRKNPRLKGIISENPEYGINQIPQIDTGYRVYLDREQNQYRFPYQKDTGKVSKNQIQYIRLLGQTVEILLRLWAEQNLGISQYPEIPKLNRQVLLKSGKYNPFWAHPEYWKLSDIQDLTDSREFQIPELEPVRTPVIRFLAFTDSLKLPLDLNAKKPGYAKSDPSEESRLYPESMLTSLTELLQAHNKIPVTGLSKDTVQAILDTDESILPADSDIRTVLKLRQALSKTSIKKYQTMVDTAVYDNSTQEYRGHDLIQFYGARTGRFSGAIIQPQNLAKNTIPNKELDEVHRYAEENKFENFLNYRESPETLLSQLIRTAFIPGKGKTFIVSDFSAIEARALSFITGVNWRIRAFQENKDIYCESASKIFNCKVVKHGENGELRAQGKVAELACGYGGGVNAMKRMDFNHVISDDDKYQEIVHTWRSNSPEIPRAWSDFETAAREVIQNPELYSSPATPRYVFQTLSKKKTNGKSADTKKGSETLHVYGTYGAKKNQNPKNNTGFYFYMDTVNIPNQKNETTQILRLHLPSGRFISWWAPEYDKESEEISFLIQNQTTRKWERKTWWGGVFVENATQAYCRDILCEKMKKIESNPNYHVVFHIHDELVVEVPKELQNTALADIDNIMAEPVLWACDSLLPNSNTTVSLPLKGGTYQCDFYRKD